MKRNVKILTLSRLSTTCALATYAITQSWSCVTAPAHMVSSDTYTIHCVQLTLEDGKWRDGNSLILAQSVSEEDLRNVTRTANKSFTLESEVGLHHADRYVAERIAVDPLPRSSV